MTATLDRRTMKLEEAAAVLGIGRRAAYRGAARGEIPTIRVGRLILVPVAELERLLGERDTRDHQGPVAA